MLRPAAALLLCAVTKKNTFLEVSPRRRYCTPMSDTPVGLLRMHSRHAPWNARGLAAHATALVDAAGMRPTNASARATPSARAIRFYVAHGLIDHPEGKGTAATYHYRHLLQLLAIKIRQREGQTLESIKGELQDLAGDLLERRVAQSLAPALGAGADHAVAHDGDDAASWRRVVVADGIELHVRHDSPAGREDALVAMREAVRAALGRENVR
jgi:DNA-binding transcriptional MerR regulator